MFDLYLFIYLFNYFYPCLSVCLTNQLSISISIYIIYLGRRTKDSCYLTYNCTHISSHISIYQTNYLFSYLSVSVYLSNQLLYISLSIYIIYLGSRTQGSSCWSQESCGCQGYKEGQESSICQGGRSVKCTEIR